MEEVWKDIEGYEGYYQVSNLGRVKIVEREVLRRNGTSMTVNEKILAACGTPYKHVGLSRDNITDLRRVHRLVAESFIPNPDGLNDVDHINCDKTDNRVSNLRWCSRKQNIQYAQENGLLRPQGYNKWSKEKQKHYSRIRRKAIVRSDGKEYLCTQDAADDLGVTYSVISHVLRGLTETCKGYSFKYLHKEEHK